jgi:hypothetical protein
MTHMRGIYNNIPEINHVSKVHYASVPAVPRLPLMKKFCNSTLVLYEACVQFSVWSVF